jgi:hypothetical protein
MLARLCAYKFLGDCVLIYPLYALMMERRGLNPAQLSSLFIVWSVTAFAAEVPTGMLADRVPRRNVLALGGLLTALGWACWLLWPGYWGFLAGFVLWGVGGACDSGAFEALAYAAAGASDAALCPAASGPAQPAGHVPLDFTRLLGQTRAAAFCGILSAGLGASLAVRLGASDTLLLGLSIIAALLSGAAALSLPSAAPVPTEGAAGSPRGSVAGYLAELDTGLRYTLARPALLRLVVLIALSVGLYGSLEEYFALLARDSGLPEAWQGLLLAAIAAAQALGAAQAWRLGQGVSGARWLLLFAGALLLVGGVLRSPVGLACLLLFCLAYTAAETLLAARLQGFLPDAQRATLGSLSGFAGEVWAVAVYAGAGAVATHWSYALAFAAGGACLLAIGLGTGRLR